MDDEALELTRKCAEAINYRIDSVVGSCCYHYNANGSTYKYDPQNDPAQAFELLCWLAGRGTVEFDIFETPTEAGEFRFWGHKDGPHFTLPCPTIPELRLAIMRAVCKVKEGK